MKKFMIFLYLILDLILVSPAMLFCMKISKIEKQEAPKKFCTLARIRLERSQRKLEALNLDSKEGKKPDHRSSDRTKPSTNPNNFHVVVDKELYRSAELSPQDLEAYIQKFGIKSVINLRKQKNRKEKAAAAKLLGKNNYYHVSMCSRRLPSIESLEQLIDIFKHAQKPMLVHCAKGIDRTGQAAALYLYVIKNKSKKEALEQLSPHFGYRVKLFPGKAFLIYLLPDNPEIIPAWIKKTYNPYGYEWCEDIKTRFERDFELGDLDPKAFLRDFKEGCDLGRLDLALADNAIQQARLQKEKEAEPDTDPIFDTLYN